MRQIMDNGKILIVNLSKGLIGEENAQFLGLLLVPKILSAAMSRADMPENQRRDFYLYVDEFGKVHRCSQKRKKTSKLLMEYTKADLRSEFYTGKPCVAYCTIGCVRTASKIDEWRHQEPARDVDQLHE